MKRSTKTAEFCFFAGAGPTRAEAEKAARLRAERFCEDTKHRSPVYIEVGGWAAVVWRAHACWTYTIVRRAGEESRGEIQAIMTQGEAIPRGTTVLDAIRHLAACAWTLDVKDDVAFFAAAHEANALPHTEKAVLGRSIQTSVEQAQWQRLYAKAKAAGASDEEAHKAASDGRDARLALARAA